jgi:hypothetical protein
MPVSPSHQASECDKTQAIYLPVHAGKTQDHQSQYPGCFLTPQDDPKDTLESNKPKLLQSSQRVIMYLSKRK